MFFAFKTIKQVSFQPRKFASYFAHAGIVMGCVLVLGGILSFTSDSFDNALINASVFFMGYIATWCIFAFVFAIAALILGESFIWDNEKF